VILAALRPGDWNLPVLVHVAGAMVLVAAVVVVLLAMAGAARDRDGAAVLTRLGYRALLVGVIPSYLVMRVGAEWATSQEKVDAAGWVGIGRSVADGGLLLVLVGLYLAFRASRRRPDGPGGLPRAVAAIMGVLLVAYVVATWAMATKPA
jgi:hypothetical protein